MASPAWREEAAGALAGFKGRLPGRPRQQDPVPPRLRRTHVNPPLPPLRASWDTSSSSVCHESHDAAARASPACLRRPCGITGGRTVTLGTERNPLLRVLRWHLLMLLVSPPEAQDCSIFRQCSARSSPSAFDLSCGIFVPFIESGLWN